MSTVDKNIVKSWLKTILIDENITDFSVNSIGNTVKGAGYLSDILFVEVDANIPNEPTKKLSLVLKSAKKDDNLGELSPMLNVFLSEAYMYNTVLLTFRQFQLERGVDEIFDNIPKYYGKFISEDIKVFALENLTPKGYKVWDKKKPLTRKHIDLVLGGYAKLHATSAAIRDQKPEVYENLVSGLKPAFVTFMETSNMDFMFGSKIEKACELLKNEVDDQILEKWKNFRKQISSVFSNMYYNKNGFKVFVHGDCWINNFMFNYKNDNEVLPLNAILLDLQLTSNSSPILDLSYFLFSTISEKDIEDLDDILADYYKKFSKYLQKLGSEAKRIYPYEAFLTDWKTHCKYGLAIVPTNFYTCATDESEVIDTTNVDLAHIFTYEIKNPAIFKYRMTYIMKYVTRHNLI